MIGGGATYADALPLCERVYATEVEAELDGDAFFPAIDAGPVALRGARRAAVENDLGFTFKIYERSSAAV